MKKQLLFFLSLLFCSWGYSQTISPEVIATSGEHFISANAQLSWTIGELMIETYSTGSNQLTQGFHQTNLTITAVEDLAEDFQLKVYPNPTKDLVNVEFLESPSTASVIISDAHGRTLILKEAIQPLGTETFNLSSYPAGAYFLQVRNEEQQVIKTFQILKLK